MKRLGLILGTALVAAVLGYFLVGLRHSRGADALTGARGDDLAWIRAEFPMSDEQFSAVRKLHEDYAGQCAQHCADIMVVRSELDALRAAAATPAALAEAERRVGDLETECNNATRGHLRRVAAAMPPREGRRFLRTVEPHLAQLPHDGRRSFSD